MIVYIFAEGYIVIFDVLGAHPCDDLELVIIHDDFEAFSFTDWAPPLSMAWIEGHLDHGFQREALDMRTDVSSNF